MGVLGPGFELDSIVRIRIGSVTEQNGFGKDELWSEAKAQKLATTRVSKSGLDEDPKLLN